jgi:hypothetical protein
MALRSIEAAVGPGSLDHPRKLPDEERGPVATRLSVRLRALPNPMLAESC